MQRINQTKRATSLIVTLPSDSDNLFVVLSARQINANLKIISRLNNAADEPKLRRAGADHVVMPEQIGGFYMATSINKPDLMEFFSLISNLGKNQVVYEEIAVVKLKQQFRNRSIAEGGIQALTHIGQVQSVTTALFFAFAAIIIGLLCV